MEDDRLTEGQADGGGAGATLGDVLYADRSSRLVPETDWVRVVHRIQAGDPAALHALYERMHPMVYTLIVRLTQSRETAEELTVDVFHDVWRRAAAYDPLHGTVVAWVMNQARSRAIDRLRYEHRIKRVDPYPGDPSGHDVRADPHDEVAMKERRRLVRDALAVLSDAERQAIEIAFFADLSYSEVAVRLNEPLGTIKTRVRSGLAKLRRRLGDMGAAR